VIGLIGFAFIVGLIWLEVIVFGLVGQQIGAGFTIIGVFVTAAIGLRLFRLSGQATMQRMAASAAKGLPPVLEVTDGAAIVIAAGLLLIPGYATDALGLILFIPGLRSVIIIVLFFMLHKMILNLNLKQKFDFNFTQGDFKDGFNPFHRNDPSAQHEETNHSMEPISDDDIASNTTIEGQYKRED
jgi:UPF0716 family protein affecting phage T7 exclusion